MKMLKYGFLARGIELMCFKPALNELEKFYPALDKRAYKKKVKNEFKAMLLRTSDIVDAMITAVFESPFIVKAHKNKKCTLFTDKVQDKKLMESKKSQHSKYELDWKFKYEKGVDECCVISM